MLPRTPYATIFLKNLGICRISMDSIMPTCTTTLYHFDSVTDSELLKSISGMNKTACSSDPCPTRLLMSHLHTIIPIIQHY